MIPGCNPRGWRHHKHLSGEVSPLRRCPPLAGRRGALKGPLILASENILCQATPLPGTVFSGVSAGSLHWSAVNQVILFLWVTLISFCWQQAVAWGPAAFRRLPAHVGRKSSPSSHCEPGSVLGALNACLLKCSHGPLDICVPPHFTDKETEIPWIAQGHTTNGTGRAGIWTYVYIIPEHQGLTPVPYC